MRSSAVHWIPKLLISLFTAHASLTLSDTTGLQHKPLAPQNGRGVVIIFTAVDCPISNSYATELNRIIADEKQFDFYVVYSDPTLSAKDAEQHRHSFNYTCPGLLDPTQILAKKLHATVTPEVAVLDAQGKLLYEGRIDNRYEDLGKQRYAATTHDLRDALDAVAAGKTPTVAATKPIGCPL